MKIVLSILLLLTLVNADKLETSKTSCIQQSAYADKTLAEQKKILVEKAKQESLEELYGTLISSSIDIKDGKLISDSIKSRAVGAVRVKGNPSFYNGKNLGEICADVKVYITKKDLEMYRPKKVTLTHFCFNNPAVAMKDIKQQSKYAAYKEIVSQYKPSLKLSAEEAEKLIHGFKISNDNFDFDTASYCFNAVGTVLPYEVEMGVNIQTKKVVSKKEPISKNQIWRGYYRCSQGKTNLDVIIHNVDNNNIKATFKFSGNGRGEFELYGKYNKETKELDFKPGRWLYNPNSYGTVGMKGYITNKKIYRGIINSSGCKEFELELQR